MVIRFVFLLFLVVLVGFAYVSLLNGQHIPFYLAANRVYDVTVSELSMLSFAVGAAMVILFTLVKDVTTASKDWKERREKQRRDAARARVAKARDLFQRGMIDDAAKELERSLSVNADDREALLLLADVEAERKNPLEAVKALTRAKQADPSDLGVYFRLARTYQEMNDAESALSLLAAIEDSQRENPRALGMVRDLRILRGEMIPAYAAQKNLLKILGKNAGPGDLALFDALRYEKAVARMAAGKTDDAERRLRDLVKERPDFAPPYIALSEHLVRRGSTEEATECLLRGFRATRNPVFLIKLEDLAVETERPQAMMGIYADLQQEFPSGFDVNIFLGKFYLRIEMNDEALEQLLKTESLDPEHESIQILLAEALRRRGRYESACQHYQRAIGYRRRYLVPFRCKGCGASTIKWTPRCPSCGRWDSFAIDHGHRHFAVPASER